MLLETLGGEVSSAHDQAETERMIRDRGPSVLVLCYTLSEEERAEVLASARTLNPRIRVLVLLADGSADLRTNEDVFNIFRGPAALKTKIQQMLQSLDEPSCPQF
jgi:DNA-binding NtrC family response regulator